MKINQMLMGMKEEKEAVILLDHVVHYFDCAEKHTAKDGVLWQIGNTIWNITNRKLTINIVESK